MNVALRPVAAAVLFVAALPLAAAREGGPIPVQLPLFPGNNWWNTDITNAPLDPDSGTYIAFIGTTRRVHPDFGGDVGDGSGETYGIPFIVVDDSQGTTSPTFTDYDTESDHVPYPIPDEAITNFGWIEGGEPGNQDPGGDRHMLIVNRTQNTLFEMGNVFYNGSGWQASGGAFFDMKTNNRRPEGWTSADAAGLAILPGLVRYDEAKDLPEITHAFRVTLRDSADHFVFPASHVAGSNGSALPFGARLRLKAATNLSAITDPIALKIAKALKRYGLIFADNGSDMYITGTYDTRWNNDILNSTTTGLSLLKASDFEVVFLGWQPPTALLVTAPLSGGTSQNVTVKAVGTDGATLTGYLGTVHFTCNPGCTAPGNYTFTSPGDNGVHTFAVSGLPPGYTSITVTDTTPNSTITGSVLVSSGPRPPVGVNAKLITPSQILVSWEPPAGGAASYVVQRRNGAGNFATVPCTMVGTTCQDNAVSAPTVYVYRVCAETVSDTTCSLPDVASDFAYTDDPIVPGTTAIKAQHITELRTAVNLLRETAHLADASFTDDPLDKTIAVQAVHLQELQDALNEARTALLLIPNSYHDFFYDNSVFIKSPNVQELRNGTK